MTSNSLKVDSTLQATKYYRPMLYKPNTSQTFHHYLKILDELDQSLASYLKYLMLLNKVILGPIPISDQGTNQIGMQAQLFNEPNLRFICLEDGPTTCKQERPILFLTRKKEEEEKKRTVSHGIYLKLVGKNKSTK